MTGIIDADTHIAESESMWKLFDKDCISADLSCLPPRTTPFIGILMFCGLSTEIFFQKPAAKAVFASSRRPRRNAKPEGPTLALVAVKLPTSKRAWPTWTTLESPCR